MTASQSGTGSSSSAVRDRLSVLAHCAKGGTVSFGPPRPQPKAAQVAATPDSLLTPMVGPAAAAWVPQALELPEAEEAASGIGAEVEYEELPQHQTSRYLGQYFGNCIPRLDGSSERPSLAGKLRSGEPRAKSYAPAKTLGEAVAPCYVHPPKWSFGGGKSRSTTLSATDGGSHSVGSFASLKRRPKRTLSRGFGTGGRTSLRPSSESPGPGTYDLFRVGDEVPVWASGSRLPWGTRTGGRTKLVHSASEVGPGEYTAEHGLVPAGPTAKIGQKIKDLPDSRINYPAPGHYPVKGTVAQKKPYQKGCDSPGIMGSGQRSTLSGKDEGPGFVYSPGVEASSHAQTWAQGERKSWLDADPDEPPGPGAYDPQDSLDAYNGKRSGWPKDEKQHRKMAGLLPADNPSPDYHVPLERIGWKIGFQVEIPPLAHFWSMRLAVLNSVLNPIIGAAMCKPYRRGYLFIICTCLRCCCGFRYNMKDPWKHTRRLSTCSRTSYVGDKNKPGKSPTESDKIRNVPSFTSYNDSGIDPDSNEYEGSFGYQHAEIVNTTCELDNAPATRHAKKRPRLTQKRISFKDEVELEKLAELALGETEAQNDTVGTSDSQQFSMASSVDVQRNLVITRSDDNYQGNRTERGLKNTSDETHLIAVSMGTESVIQVSSDEKQRENQDAFGCKEKLTEDTTPNSHCNNGSGTYLNGHMKSMEDKTGKNYVNSRNSFYQEQSHKHSPIHTIQVTHFGVDKNSNINTATLKSPILTDNHRSKSPSVFLPFSPRSNSFIERVRRTSAPERKLRSQSLSKDDGSLDAPLSSCIESISKKTKPKNYDSTKKQRGTDPRTGALFDIRRTKADEELSLDFSPHLGKSRSFESVLSSSDQRRLDEPEFRDLIVSPRRGRSYAVNDELSQGLCNHSYSESDLTSTSPERVFLTENPSSRGHKASHTTGAQGDAKRYQSGEQIPQNILPSPDRIYRQLSDLNKEELAEEFFC